MNLLKVIKYLKVAIKIVTILPMAIAGIKKIIEEVQQEIKEQGL